MNSTPQNPATHRYLLADICSPRRQSLNGKWRIVMDEDVLQAILTHWIGHKWIVEFKWMLKDVINGIRGDTTGLSLPETEKAKRSYFFGQNRTRKMENLEQYRQNVYINHFFLAPMPSSEFEDAFSYDDTDDDYDQSERLDPDKLAAWDLKRLLLRTVTTETLIRRTLDGEAAIVQSDFQWFATSLSHSTVFSILRFVGCQDEWISFFKKALETPLDMLTGEPIRIRKRGLPMGHIFERLFGELVLFFMDLAVVQEADLRLYRFHDDLWLYGQPDKCAKAWNTMQVFAKVMGLEFNQSKTGSAYIVDEAKKGRNPDIMKALPDGQVKMDFLVLDPTSGDWVVDKEHVLQHARQLRKQLSGAQSVLEWVKTWNSCIGRFFNYTFGEPANCFGRKHLNTILEVHKPVQDLLFSGDEGNSVTEHLSKMICKRFNVHAFPDGFLYMPEAIGGLGLKNPFVPLFLVSENLIESPDAELVEYLKSEQESYLGAKREFERLSETERRTRYRGCFPHNNARSNLEGTSDDTLSWENAQQFPSFEQFMEYRDVASRHLLSTYTKLVTKAENKEIPLHPKVKEAVDRGFSSRGGTGGRSVQSGWQHELAELDDETRWLVNFYADELLEKCGSLRIVDKSFLPLGVLKAMRKRKVAWQMAL